MFTDTEIGNAYYQIEYGTFVYDEHFVTTQVPKRSVKVDHGTQR
jgi:hypothetical protein